MESLVPTENGFQVFDDSHEKLAKGGILLLSCPWILDKTPCVVAINRTTYCCIISNLCLFSPFGVGVWQQSTNQEKFKLLIFKLT